MKTNKNGLTQAFSREIITGPKDSASLQAMRSKDETMGADPVSGRQTSVISPEVEQANRDAERLDFASIKTYYDGSPTIDTLKEFIGRLPYEEQLELLSERGEPTRGAERRFMDAVIAATYQNDELTQLHAELLFSNGKNIVSALEKSAVAINSLKGLPNGFDIRDVVANCAIRAIDASENNKDLYGMIGQMDLFDDRSEDKAEGSFIKMFADNHGNRFRISEKLNKLAEKLTKCSQVDRGADRSIRKISSRSASSNCGANRPKMTREALNYWKREGGAFLDAVFNDKPVPSEFLRGLRALGQAKA